MGNHVGKFLPTHSGIDMLVLDTVVIEKPA
jgi:hypothetical protein